MEMDDRDKTPIVAHGTRDTTEITVSGQVRPSYLEATDDHSPPQSQISEEVVKNLSEELEAVEPETEFIKTYLRIRPTSSTKTKPVIKKEDKLYQIETPTTLLVNQSQLLDNKKSRITATRFTFTGILGADRSQYSVFEEVAMPLVDKFIKGENCLVFCYGATNSGKSYSMQGYGTNFGIIPRTLDCAFNRMEGAIYTRGDVKPNQFEGHITISSAAFKQLEDAKYKMLREAKFKSHELESFRESCLRSSALSLTSDMARKKAQAIFSAGRPAPAQYEQGRLYSVWVSYAEIYNDRVYDLFEAAPKGGKRKELKLYQDNQGRVYINDLTEFNVKNAEEAYQIFLTGRLNLQFASTNVNTNSSRSHSFFSVRVISLGLKGGFVYPLKVFRLAFCDLAGIERVSQTGNVGTRLKESGNINQSLLVLLRCIRALRDRQGGKLTSDVVPFRDSKLSRLFKSYLTASNLIRMLVTINPDPSMSDSTFQVLSNASVASRVQLAKPVEAPSSNTNFCRRVRESLGLPPPPLIKEEPESEEESEYSSAEETIDFVDDTPATTKWVTVRKGTIAPTRIEILERENRKLREELRKLQDDIHEKIHAKYEAVYEQQEEFYRNLLKDNKEKTDEIHRQRLSLAKDCFRHYPEAILNVPGASYEAIVTKIPKKAPESKKKELRLAHEDRVAAVKAKFAEPSTSSESAETLEVKINAQEPSTVQVQEKGNYKEKCEALVLQVSELQKLLVERDSMIKALRDELVDVIEERDKEEKEKKHVERLLEVLREEKEKIELEHKNKRYSMLSVELAKEREIVEFKEKELADATKLCQNYHSALDEANTLAMGEQAKYAELELEVIKLKEEEEFLHFTVDDLEEKNQQLKADIEKLKMKLESDSEKSDNSSGGSSSSRPRRAGASYK